MPSGGPFYTSNRRAQPNVHSALDHVGAETADIFVATTRNGVPLMLTRRRQKGMVVKELQQAGRREIHDL